MTKLSALSQVLTFTTVIVSSPRTLVSQTKISPEAKHHITEIVDALRSEWIHRGTMNWALYQAQVMRKANRAQTVEDTYEAIRYGLELLGDNHSHYISSNRQRIFGPTAAALRADRCSPPEFAEPNVPQDIGYVRVQITPQTSTEDIQKSIRAQAKRAVSGWILDLRNSRGGSMWPALTGLGSLLGNGTVGYFIDPRGDAIPWGYSSGHSWLASDTVLTIRRPAEFAKPAQIAVLTDAGVLSSGEAIAIAFRFRPNTRSFGTPTCGLSTVTRPVRLSNGGMIVITVGYVADRMKNTYGGTVEPDELVVNSDALLRRAISWLREQ